MKQKQKEASFENYVLPSEKEDREKWGQRWVRTKADPYAVTLYDPTCRYFDEKLQPKVHAEYRGLWYTFPLTAIKQVLPCADESLALSPVLSKGMFERKEPVSICDAHRRIDSQHDTRRPNISAPQRLHRFPAQRRVHQH